jgi:hypothetical protein
MASARESLREGLRMGGRDYSLLAAAGMLVLFGLAVNNHIIPNFHEQQALEKRRNELQESVKQTRAEVERIKDEAEALDDPYYMAWYMVENYNWRYPPIEETPSLVQTND